MSSPDAVLAATLTTHHRHFERELSGNDAGRHRHDRFHRVDRAPDRLHRHTSGTYPQHLPTTDTHCPSTDTEHQPTAGGGRRAG